MTTFLFLLSTLLFQPHSVANPDITAIECNRAKLIVLLNANELEKLRNMAEVLPSAKFCDNHKVKGCSVESVLKGGIIERLGLKDGDVLTESTLGPITSIQDALKAFDGIGHEKVHCLLLLREGNPSSLAYVSARP